MNQGVLMKNPWFWLCMLFLCCFGGCTLFVFGGAMNLMDQQELQVKKEAVLYLELEGVIIDGKQFLKDLRKYAKQDNIRGVLVRINSPGGVVGPSQEIYQELNRVRKDYKKPVVVSANAVMASGAYYAAVAADKVFVNPGTLMGSIGVIMEFANLEKLYDWAMIKRYSLTTGDYKDTGSDSRPMRVDEKELLQNLIDEVHDQFKTAVQEGRNLNRERVESYADGRIFTGKSGVKLGFADEVGGFQDAMQAIGEMTNLGEEPELFDPNKNKKVFLQFVDDMQGSFSLFPGSEVKRLLPLDLIGKPLYLMPGHLGN